MKNYLCMENVLGVSGALEKLSVGRRGESSDLVDESPTALMI